MPNNSFSQQALAADSRFRLRLQNALMKVAWEVLEEDVATPDHVQRGQYARSVISTPAQAAAQLAPSFVNRPNVFAFDTSYSFDVGAVLTASGDADMESQLHTDWDEMAGVGITTGPGPALSFSPAPPPPAQV